MAILDLKREINTRGFVKIRVKTGKKEFKIEKGDDGLFMVHVTSKPIEGLAHLEIIKKLSKLLGFKVKIKSGLNSKTKIIVKE